VQVDDVLVLICAELHEPDALGPPFFLLQAHASFRATCSSTTVQPLRAAYSRA
jgi:hypothetical protein